MAVCDLFAQGGLLANSQVMTKLECGLDLSEVPGMTSMGESCTDGTEQCVMQRGAQVTWNNYRK